MSLRVNLIIRESNSILFEALNSIPKRRRAEYIRSLSTAFLLHGPGAYKPNTSEQQQDKPNTSGMTDEGHKASDSFGGYG